MDIYTAIIEGLKTRNPTIEFKRSTRVYMDSAVAYTAANTGRDYLITVDFGLNHISIHNWRTEPTRIAYEDPNCIEKLEKAIC